MGLVWNEVSRRYVDDEPEFYFPEVWRGKPENAKQGSSGEFTQWDTSTFQKMYESLNDTVEWYLAMVSDGIAPEQARMVLPQNTMTEWIWTGSLMAFARVCKQRLDPHAQAETQEVAHMIKEIIEPLFPVSFKALME